METKKKAKKTVNKKKRLIIAASVFFSSLLLLVLVFYGIFSAYYNKMNYQPVDTAQPTISDSQLEPEYEDSEGPDSSQSEIDKVEESIENVVGANIPVKSSKDVFNVLLIGIDSRENNGRGRSDSMILLSINKKSKKIIATSILRDIYVQIPGHQNNRINAAFALGGPKLLLDTISTNFRVKIDRYAYINFYSFTDIVDAVGGVTLEVSQKEIPVINEYIQEMNQLTKQPAGKDFLKEPGKLNLNGKQALGYARNRYVGNADFERTARQRRVMEQVFSKAKGLNPIQLNNLMNKILPSITTDLTEKEILSYLVGAPGYFSNDIEQFRIPVDKSYQGLRIRGMAVLGIDFKKNIDAIHDKIYSE